MTESLSNPRKIDLMTSIVNGRRIVTRVSDELHAAIMGAARDRNINVSSLVRHWLRSWAADPLYVPASVVVSPAMCEPVDDSRNSDQD